VADAEDLIRLLQLEVHPEGGWFRRTWTSAVTLDGGRATASAIWFLLAADERSHWHRVDAEEVWLFHAGDPLELEVEGEPPVLLGPDLVAGHRPQHVVPAGAWQAASSTGAFTLVSCVVSPAFVDEGFELAPPGWTP
jgi:uncharacterized protein